MSEITILEKIVAQKKLDVALLKEQLPLDKLQKLTLQNKTKAPSFYESLCQDGPSIIAEIKRHSPSKGPLRPELDPIELATEYEQNGARAISVLTEEKFFHGCTDDLLKVKSKVKVPILRKDFTVDEYQIWEAKLIGASAILLIAAILTEQELVQFTKLAQELELDVLVEVHNREEILKALKAKPKILGVNNRNLHTFEVSLQTSYELIKEFQNSDTALWISESGIDEEAQVAGLMDAGYKAFLIGESLLKASKPANKLKQLLKIVN
jgi:indole-3-glycerol phosphate synthase